MNATSNRIINELLSVIECPFNDDPLRKSNRQGDPRSLSHTRPTNNCAGIALAFG